MDKIKIANKEIMKVDKGIIAGLATKDKVKLHVVGSLGFEDMLDLLNTVQFELLTAFEKQADGKVDRKDIYDRAVLGFSLMIDKYYPEGAENRFHGLTDQAILEKQNEILQRKRK